MAFAAACVLGLCAGVARAQFTTTWTGSAASGDWSTAGNWNNGAPTTSGTWALTFANTTQTSSTNTTGGASDTVTLSSLTITSNTAVALARTESRTLTLINNSSIYIGGTNSINHTSSIPLTLLGSSTVSGVSNRNLQWNAVISGTGSLSLTGGTLYLGSGVVNTFSGGLTISSGASLDVAGISALGTGPLTINGGLLNARGGLRTVTNSGVINGDFTFGGTNPLVLSGSFDLNGGTRVITLNGSPNAGTMSGVISNGGITKAGLAPLVLSGTNTYSGATTINSGTLQIGSGATTGSLNPASTITGSAGATLAFNRSNSVTQGTDFTSVISGSIGVAQVGSGTLVLGGANTYSGKTSIQNGTLSVATINNASASGNLGTNATIDFGSSTTAGALVYTGAGETTNRVVNLAATTGGGVLDQSGSGLLRFTADVTTTGVGPKTLTVRGSTAGTGELSGRITDGVTGTTTLTSQFGTGTTTITLDSVSGISVGAAISGANIPASTTVTAINAATRVITLSQATTTGTTAAGSLITVAGVTNPNTLTKAGTGTWTLSGSNSYTGTTSINAGMLQIGSGSTAGSLSTSSVITGSAGATLAFNRSDTVTQGTDFNSVIGGAINVAQVGSGAFTLSGANTHTGTTSISNGTLVLANVLAVQNSTLDTGAVGSQAITFTVAGTNTYTLGGLQGFNGLAIGANTISVGGNNASTTFSGAIAGAGGGLTKTGTGLLTLSGTNTYTGITTLNSGTLRAGAAAGGQAFGNLSAVSLANAAGVTLDLNGFSQTIGSLAGGGASGGAVSLGAGTLTTGGDNTSTSFAGIISGSGGLTKTGTGVLTLSGANTYTGLTTVAAGVLATTADSRIPGGSSIVMSGGTLQFGGGNTVAAISGTAGTIDISSYRLTSSLATSSTFSGTLVGNRPASAGQGASGFQKSGSGTLTLAGNVLLSVDSSVAQGFNNPLQVNAGELVLAGTTTLTNVENRINGTGAVQRITNGSHSLNSVNIQNGTFIVDNGFVAVQGMSIGFSSVTGATNVVTINGGTLSSPSAGISLGNNTGATQTPTLNLNGGALETISIPNGGSGTNSITFNGGTLRMLGTSVIPSNTNSGGNLLALNVGDGGAILDTGTFANTISQGFVGVGSGGLTKLGSAQLTLSGTSTYTGATTVSAGTLAFDRIAALATTSGIGIASGAGLTYTGTTGALNRAITVTSGTGTVRNSGGGTLTLGGTLTKDGSVLRLTGGRFNVTGQIVGSSPNSDLLVDGTSTVTLSTVNSYNGPTFVNQASNLIVGVNDAIPNGSIVTLGSATTTGTLTLGSFSDAIGGLAFGAGGGTLRMTASATGATAQLTAASGTMNLSGGTLDLTGSGTSDGLYRLLSAQSITNAFTNITGTTTAYQILTTSTSIDYQQRAVLGTVSVTNPSVSIITGGSAAFTYTVANNALSGGAGLTFTGAGLANVVGSTLGSVNAGGTSDAIAGLVFTGTSIGSSQQGTFTVSDPSAFGTTSATGIVSVNVLNHSLASFEASDTATLSLDLGTYDTASGWTSGSGSLGFSIWNIASGGFANADTAGLALYDVVFTSGNDVFSTGLTNFANLASGTFNGSTASVLAPGSLAEGTYQGVYTLKFRDQQNLSGAANTRDLTLTANVIVVPEPGAFMLAGIGIGLAGWLLRRTGR